MAERNTLYFEDINEGDEIPPFVVQNLTRTDLVRYEGPQVQGALRHPRMARRHDHLQRHGHQGVCFTSRLTPHRAL